jgi:hypothetical protein
MVPYGFELRAGEGGGGGGGGGVGGGGGGGGGGGAGVKKILHLPFFSNFRINVP